MEKHGKIDPASAIKEKQEQDKNLDDMEKMDISTIKMSDFKAVPRKRARYIHPFEGYPLAPEVELGQIGTEIVPVKKQVEVEIDKEVEIEVPKLDDDGNQVFYKSGPKEGQPRMEKKVEIQKVKKIQEKVFTEERPVYLKVSKTFIIALDPNQEPEQDPSGLGISILNQKTKKEEIHDFKTYHSRFIRTGPNANEDVVFDREMNIEGQIVHYAVVPSHEVRCQIIYYYDSRNERFETDKRYRLLDIGQAARLMNLFQDMMKPALAKERMAAQLSGEIESTETELKAVPTEA